MSLVIGALTEHCLSDPTRIAHAAVPLLAPTARGLLHADRAGVVPVPDLAAWHTVSRDGVTHVFGLRSATFHDGAPVRASDVARSFARLVAPGSTATLAGSLRGLLWRGGPSRAGDLVEAIVPDDARGEVAIRLAAPFGAFADLLAHPSLGVARADPDGTVVGCGPLRPIADGPGIWRLVPHSDNIEPRRLRNDLSLRAFGTIDALHQALQQRLVDVVAIERQHYPRFEGHASTSLRDRWVGAMMLNAGGALQDIGPRRDFARVVHAVAAATLPAAACTRLLLPEGLATAAYHDGASARLPPPLSARDFSDRWRTLFVSQPVRIVFSPGRGPLTRVLEALIDELAAAKLPLRVVNEPEPAGVYALVAQGAVDVVARGWSQDYDDPEEFFGIYDKQAPGALAQSPVRWFAARVSEARHASAHERLAACTEALLEIEAKWLCVPFCRDANRLFHAADVRLRAHERDTFKPVDRVAAESAGCA
ncbi:ABC transporter substrate-binding protein [Undibacterium sp. Di26W]|uniref:ABC transporter substrate-binding protein n=1 Tax=Undibacterium sp. Di26W TaxID=3413035 RepID=UPI003BF2C03D